MLGKLEIDRVYCCDNMELMKQIPDNSIDLIYSDILYGTGRKFDDFEDLKPIKSEIDTFYNPRIKEMHRILKTTGTIYLQMDTRINHWVRLIMDEVFSYDNFINEISWWYKRWTRPSNSYQKMHDVILFYSKSSTYNFTPQLQPYSKESVIEETVRYFKDGKSHRLKDENGNYVKREKENKGVAMHDVWEIQHLQPTSKERLGYDTQKPKRLLEIIINSSSKEGEIVADFFCGSGTSLEVAQYSNRKFIGCDISEKAISITNKRLKNNSDDINNSSSIKQ